jgi:hypothetical protein
VHARGVNELKAVAQNSLLIFDLSSHIIVPFKNGINCFVGGFVIALTVGLPLFTLLGLTYHCYAVRFQLLSVNQLGYGILPTCFVDSIASEHRQH